MSLPLEKLKQILTRQDLVGLFLIYLICFYWFEIIKMHCVFWWTQGMSLHNSEQFMQHWRGSWTRCFFEMEMGPWPHKLLACFSKQTEKWGLPSSQLSYLWNCVVARQCKARLQLLVQWAMLEALLINQSILPWPIEGSQKGISVLLGGINMGYGHLSVCNNRERCWLLTCFFIPDFLCLLQLFLWFPWQCWMSWGHQSSSKEILVGSLGWFFVVVIKLRGSYLGCS